MIYELESGKRSNFSQATFVIIVFFHFALALYPLAKKTSLLSVGENLDDLSIRVLLEKRSKAVLAPKAPAPVKKKVVKKEKAPVKKAAPTKEIIEKVERPSSSAKSSFDSLIKEFVRPSYPRVAIKRGMVGTAVLTILINSDGSVNEVILSQSSGHSILDRSALNAAKKWKFKAAADRPNSFRRVRKNIVYSIE